MVDGMTLDSLKTNLESEVGGVWFDYPGTPIKLKIARAGNIEFDKEFRKILKGTRMSILEIETDAFDLQKLAVAKHILIDWKGVIDEDGSLVIYDSDKGLEMFNDDEFYSFYKFVLRCSESSEKFSFGAEETILGNSDSVLTGSSGTE